MANFKKNQNATAGHSKRPAVPVSTEQEIRAGLEIQMSGPLPDPISFASYEKTTPGAGERILAMAEKEQTHRHQTESRTVDAQIEDMRKEHIENRCSQWFAFLVALAMLCIGAFLVHEGHPVYGTIVSGATIAGVVTAFLQGKRETSVASPQSPSKHRK